MTDHQKSECPAATGHIAENQSTDIAILAPSEAHGNAAKRLAVLAHVDDRGGALDLRGERFALLGASAELRDDAHTAPDDPANHRTLASIIWLNILFRRGAVTVDHYLGSFSRAKVDLSKPPPELDAEFASALTVFESAPMVSAEISRDFAITPIGLM